jgi:hypothetical protein
MKYKDARNFAVAPEMRRHAHVELSGIQIGKIVQGQRCFVAVYTLDFLVPVPGPKGPKNKIGPIGCWKKREPVDTTVLADPVSYLYMIGMCVFGETGRLGLLGREKTLL